MKLLKETTKWDSNVPNHIYAVDGYRCFGYINSRTEECTIFAKPMSFGRKGRTFREVKDPIALSLIKKLSCVI